MQPRRFSSYFANLTQAAIAVACLAALAVVLYKKLSIGGIYWSLSNYYLLGLPGGCVLLVTGFSVALRKRSRVIDWVSLALGAGCIYLAWMLDTCLLLTDYERWIDRGMQTAPQCQQCGDPVAKAVCQWASS